MRTLLIRLNNALTRWRRVRVSPGNLLLLAPHCIQNSRCEHAVKQDVALCQRCGRCAIAGLLAIRDRYGVQCYLAGGGRQAVAWVKRPGVKAVVAVACERELAAGILAAFPRPVVAVTNRRPNGPCIDTTVDLDDVEAAVVSVLDRSPASAADEEAVGALERAQG